ncbi:peptidoglycan DD-metalloendopeptidase family protein [Spongiimicrobium salis]|uniref:peptidoglycan DD-metalloendopeptidase family protein n=1 Tax=Spongiimicrobium salis TaxID=1667022 RepID=UPI00374CC494
MNCLRDVLGEIKGKFVLSADIQLDKYTPIDLSNQNLALSDFDITDPISCQKYVDTVCRKNKALVAYGGYMEKRNLYQGNTNFSGMDAEPRTIHLGVDFWAKAGTTIVAPMAGKVHSFKNNSQKGDYGPTIILAHEHANCKFHTLYGHLSLDSLDQLYIGKEIAQGAAIARLGTPEVNVNYAPHLHFQLIVDMEGMHGDYPGVCAEKDVEFYKENCPDPNILFKLP